MKKKKNGKIAIVFYATVDVSPRSAEPFPPTHVHPFNSFRILYGSRCGAYVRDADHRETAKTNGRQTGNVQTGTDTRRITYIFFPLFPTGDVYSFAIARLSSAVCDLYHRTVSRDTDRYALERRHRPYARHRAAGARAPYRRRRPQIVVAAAFPAPPGPYTTTSPSPPLISPTIIINRTGSSSACTAVVVCPSFVGGKSRNDFDVLKTLLTPQTRDFPKSSESQTLIRTSDVHTCYTWPYIVRHEGGLILK